MKEMDKQNLHKEKAFRDLNKEFFFNLSTLLDKKHDLYKSCDSDIKVELNVMKMASTVAEAIGMEFNVD